MSNNTLNATNLKNILYEIGDLLQLDTDLIDDQVQKVKKAEIKYLPIRHHSPGSSFLVKKWIEVHKPKLVLIEGPTVADKLIQFMVAKDTIPPIAILSMFSDINNKFSLNGILSPDVSLPARFEVLYPFVSYSPEMVALTECVKKKIPTHFIDLPMTGLLSFFSEIHEKKDLNSFIVQKEMVYTISKFYQKFAQVFEFDSFNETWETLFEINAPHSNINQLRESILLFCSCIRQTLDKSLLKIDGTLAREAYMKYQIEKYINKYKVKRRDVLVITGGIHSIALPDTSAKNYTFPVKGMTNSLIPFSYFRISQKSGYLSGNQAPQFYNNIWEKFNSKVHKTYEATALEIITDIFRSARQGGHLISISDSINAYNGAKMLAMLRRRSEPGLKDIVDAIYMSLIKGNPKIDGKYLEDYIYSKTIGYKVGKVTKKIGRLPLQEDFYLQLESRGIDLEERSQEIHLSLREEKDIETSQLFWRIKFLGIDYLARVSGPDVLQGITGVFTEVWALHWTPRIDTKLVELSAFGASVEEASNSMLIEETKKSIKNFNKVTNLLFQSLLMGFSDQFEKLYTECDNSISVDNQLLSLSGGFFNLIMIHQYLLMMDARKEIIELITKLINRCYYTCCYAIPNFANPPQQDAEKYIVTIKKLADSFNSITELDLDLYVFTESIKTCIDSTRNEFIKGGNLGILYLMNKLSINEIKRNVLDDVNSVQSIQVKVGDLIRGIIYVCQAKILFNKEIIELFAEVVENLEWDIFTAIVPALRKAFSELQQREYEIFIEKLAEHYGLKESKINEVFDDVDDEILIFFKSIDKKVRDVFETWFGEV